MFLVSVAVTTGESTSNYSLQVTHTVTSTSGLGGVGSMTPPPPTPTPTPSRKSVTAAPTTIVAKRVASGLHHIHVTWVEKNATSTYTYDVYRGVSGAAPQFIGSVTTKHFDDYWVQASTTYAYQVKADNPGSISDYSAPAQPKKTFSTSSLTTPSNLKVATGGGSDTALPTEHDLSFASGRNPRIQRPLLLYRRYWPRDADGRSDHSSASDEVRVERPGQEWRAWRFVVRPLIPSIGIPCSRSLRCLPRSDAAPPLLRSWSSACT